MNLPSNCHACRSAMESAAKGGRRPAGAQLGETVIFEVGTPALARVKAISVPKVTQPSERRHARFRKGRMSPSQRCPVKAIAISG